MTADYKGRLVLESPRAGGRARVPTMRILTLAFISLLTALPGFAADPQPSISKLGNYPVVTLKWQSGFTINLYRQWRTNDVPIETERDLLIRIDAFGIVYGPDDKVIYDRLDAWRAGGNDDFEFVDFNGTTNRPGLTWHYVSNGTAPSPHTALRERPLLLISTSPGRHYDVGSGEQPDVLTNWNEYHYIASTNGGGRHTSYAGYISTGVDDTNTTYVVFDDNWPDTPEGRLPFKYRIATNRFYRIKEWSPPATNTNTQASITLPLPASKSQQ
ncbi:MAG: hypothetical protein AB1705_14615 [Verrucomicrobiota bacterium]